jgi:phage terminase small subunit
MESKSSEKSQKRLMREELFAREYILDLNGAQAAIRAGYARKSARVTAARLLTKANVQSIIARSIQERAAKLELSADRVLQEIARLAFSNILDYCSSRDGQIFVDLSKLTSSQGSAIQEIAVDEEVAGTGKNSHRVRRTRLRLADKRGSLELLGKYLNLFGGKSPEIQVMPPVIQFVVVNEVMGPDGQLKKLPPPQIEMNPFPADDVEIHDKNRAGQQEYVSKTESGQ